MTRNYKISIHGGMLAYKLIKTGGCHLSFEMELSCLAAEIIDVGTINRSCKLCAEFSKSVKHVLETQLQYLMNSPHPATGKPNNLGVLLTHLIICMQICYKN